MFKFVVTECLILTIIRVVLASNQIENLDSSLNCNTPLKYYVELNVTSKHFFVKSDCIVNITCQKPVDKISVYRKQCDLQTDSINVTITEFPLSLMTLSRHPLKEQLYRVDIKKTEIRDNISFPMPITPGVYSIAAKGVCTLNYEGSFSVFSYINRSNHTKQVFVSHDRDNGVAWVVPLWYNQRVKANFLISIRHDKTYTAVSHFPGRRFPGSSKTIAVTTEFDVKFDIPINLVSIVLVPEEFTNTYVEEIAFFRRTSVWCRTEIEEYVEHAHILIHEVILNFKRKIISSKYEEVQYIVIPKYEERVTVTPGLVFLRESEIIYDEQGMTNSQKIEVELLAASSVIYHIFVDLFTIDQRDDSWFHEALLKYFAFTELYEIHLKRRDTNSLNIYIVQSQWELLYVEALNNHSLSNEINKYFFPFLRNLEGYYRVNYDLGNWRKIAQYLNSTTDFKDPVTYAQLLDDAFYFLVRNTRYDRSDIDLFFELASYLPAQTDYAAWYPMMNALEYLSSYFPFNTSISRHIKIKILTILNGFLTTTLYEEDTLLFEKNDILSYHLKYEVLKWACILKDVKCKEYIKDLILQDINNPRDNKIIVGWRERFYRQGFLMEDISFSNKLKMWHTLYSNNEWSTTKLLEYLTYFTNYENIFNFQISQCCALVIDSKSMCDFKLLQDENVIDKLFLLLAKRSYTDDVLELILQYIKHVKTSTYKIERTLAVLTITINNIYSWESFKTVERFINDIYTDIIDLRTKYKKTVIVNAIRKKFRDHFKFSWAARWQTMYG